MKICFTLLSVMLQTSQQICSLFQRVQQVILLSCDWGISIQLVCFCFWMSVTVMIDDMLLKGAVINSAQFTKTSLLIFRLPKKNEVIGKISIVIKENVNFDSNYSSLATACLYFVSGNPLLSRARLQIRLLQQTPVDFGLPFLGN